MKKDNDKIFEEIIRQKLLKNPSEELDLKVLQMIDQEIAHAEARKKKSLFSVSWFFRPAFAMTFAVAIFITVFLIMPQKHSPQTTSAKMDTFEEMYLDEDFNEFVKMVDSQSNDSDDDIDKQTDFFLDDDFEDFLDMVQFRSMIDLRSA